MESLTHSIDFTDKSHLIDWDSPPNLLECRNEPYLLKALNKIPFLLGFVEDLLSRIWYTGIIKPKQYPDNDMFLPRNIVQYLFKKIKN